ncbi:hypothetical protein [Yersinia phage fHe-Yen9-04]|uniref:Uncharacterized protein n=2 Tax=Eneladusvirus Yen904 TaxID=2560849 RepID=A0A2C9CXV0_9CAUD|nr:membrane protein [Yersinia phage fHe-Yen9-04]SOK58673.1 hypothetical protein [Yersinia phage fHe-Yen9-04]SOK59207.1 hypothetical protein [Yersinia phage fHe-Yen9-03]VUE36442.1 hypothetical protein [Yersinia phage fHe-Yen9-04]
MKPNAMNNANLYWFIFFWIAFTVVNLYINMYKPQVYYEKKLADAVKFELKKVDPVRQNEPAYIALLQKLRINCVSATDKENNTFYSCPTGEKVSMINWTRGDKKGVVTREYNKDDTLILIYGHPDDVY